MDARGSPIPLYTSPPEFLLDLSSSDFADDSHEADTNISKLHADWRDSAGAETLASSILPSPAEKPGSTHLREEKSHASFFAIVLALLHRSFIKSYRDVVAYGIRFAMYIGLAIMMGTVWLRLPETQSSIGPFTNAIFFSSAFLSFMAVAYVPAFLEDRATFVKERANGLYGATAFMISNFLIGVPYLCMFLLSQQESNAPIAFPIASDQAVNLCVSPYLPDIFHHRLLAQQFSSLSQRLLHLGYVALPRPPRWRITRRPCIFSFPQFRYCTRFDCFCERIVDECWRIFGQPRGIECVLEICIPLHRLRESRPLFFLLKGTYGT